MSRVIIDQKLLGSEFVNVVFREVDTLATELGLDKETINKALQIAQAPKDFLDIIEVHFGDRIKIRLNVG